MNHSGAPFVPTDPLHLDVLAIGAHPDDVELSAGGTLVKAAEQGKRTGIVDLTRGELGTRGSAETRAVEAAAAAEALGLVVRDNLGLKDGMPEDEEKAILALITAIRKHRPRTVLANALYDRHTDHGRAAELVHRACFLAGLARIETSESVSNSRCRSLVADPTSENLVQHVHPGNFGIGSRMNIGLPTLGTYVYQ